MKLTDMIEFFYRSASNERTAKKCMGNFSRTLTLVMFHLHLSSILLEEVIP